MKYFFIDYENVHMKGLGQMRLVAEGDTIVLLYSDICKNITLDFLKELRDRKVNFKYFKVSVGTKNALDFQLSSYLGYTVGKREDLNSEYFIVSKDMGFDRVCEFWNAQGISVKRISNLSGTNEQVQQPKKRKTNKKNGSTKNSKAVQNTPEKNLPEKEDADETVTVITRYKTRQGTIWAIIKKCKDSRKRRIAYHKRKPILIEKKKVIEKKNAGCME